MSTINNSFAIFLKFCEQNYQQTHEQLFVKYPSKEWGTLSWSYRLYLDILTSIAKIEKTTHGTINNAFSRFFVKPAHFNLFSYHFDFTHKVYLYKILKNIRNKDGILIPECGPAGFEIMIAKMAGYNKIVSYDVDPKFIECSQKIWPDVEYHVSSSKDFNFKKYVEMNYTLLMPYWGHDEINQISIPESQKISLFDKNKLNEHLNQLNLQDIRYFSEKVQEKN